MRRIDQTYKSQYISVICIGILHDTTHHIKRNSSKAKEIHCEICYHSRSSMPLHRLINLGECLKQSTFLAHPLGRNKQFKKKEKVMNWSIEENFFLLLFSFFAEAVWIMINTKVGKNGYLLWSFQSVAIAMLIQWRQQTEFWWKQALRPGILSSLF